MTQFGLRDGESHRSGVIRVLCHLRRRKKPASAAFIQQWLGIADKASTIRVLDALKTEECMIVQPQMFS